MLCSSSSLLASNCFLNFSTLFLSIDELPDFAVSQNFWPGVPLSKVQNETPQTLSVVGRFAGTALPQVLLTCKTTHRISRCEWHRRATRIQNETAETPHVYCSKRISHPL